MDLRLWPHSAAPPDAVKRVTVRIDRDLGGFQLLYAVEADPARLIVPAVQEPLRADGLWRTTCFELFLLGEHGAYREFNFSPSTKWAAYGFRGHREGRENLAVESPPAIGSGSEPFGLLVSVSLRVDVGASTRIGLSVILEESGGRKSYWALAHPPGEADFHHRDCFALDLPPAASP